MYIEKSFETQYLYVPSLKDEGINDYKKFVIYYTTQGWWDIKTLKMKTFEYNLSWIQKV